MRKAVQMKCRIRCWQSCECESWRRTSRKMRTKQGKTIFQSVMLCTRIRLQPICCWLRWMHACKAVHMDAYRICFGKDFKLLHIIVSFGIDTADQVPMAREERPVFLGYVKYVQPCWLLLQMALKSRHDCYIKAVFGNWTQWQYCGDLVSYHKTKFFP